MLNNRVAFSQHLSAALSPSPSLKHTSSSFLNPPASKGERFTLHFSSKETPPEPQLLKSLQEMIEKTNRPPEGNSQAAFLTQLLQHPNVRDSEENTPLMLAIRLNEFDFVKRFLAVPGIDVNAKNTIGWTALHLASEKGDVETLKALLENPEIDVNAQDNYGSTALHLVSEKGHVEALKALLTVPEINLNTKDTQGRTALYRANMNNQVEVQQLLVKAGATGHATLTQLKERFLNLFDPDSI